jgi:endonuclease YncB( thermonuclease family)|tara:strand:- start:47 stop:547 length:501 start_codon:yes stop_codon:yes gene_type:complete
MKIKYIFYTLFTFLILTLNVQSADWNPQIYSIVDGDTLKRNGVRYRLEGIDAPEVNQICTIGDREWECGLAATIYLEQLHEEGGFECQKLGLDRYKRILARCYISKAGNRIDIGSLMVSEGYALAYRKYSKDYINDENRAKESKRGLWKSSFTKPWEWRRARSNKR